jgi:hypothetical protein
MSRTLVYYLRERENFREDFELKLSDQQVIYIYQKLKRRFGLTQPLKISKFDQSGSASRHWIRVSHNASIAMLAHEVAHLIQFRKRDKHCSPELPKKKNFHTNEHKKLMNKVITYIKMNLPEFIDGAETTKLSLEGDTMKMYEVVKKVETQYLYKVEATNWKEAKAKVEGDKAGKPVSEKAVKATIKSIKRIDKSAKKTVKTAAAKESTEVKK